jgi:vacuolar-type H+-ATPase subunit H
MSTSNDYAEALKKLKEAEVSTAAELTARRKALEEELSRLEEESARSIEEAKAEAEAFEAKSVEVARAAAQADTEKLLSSAAKDVEKVAARRLDKKEFRKIVEDVLLSEFKED